MIVFTLVYFLQDLPVNLVYEIRFDADDCEIDESEGEDDEVNGNEDGDGDANEEDSEEGLLNISN